MTLTFADRLIIGVTLTHFVQRSGSAPTNAASTHGGDVML